MNIRFRKIGNEEKSTEGQIEDNKNCLDPFFIRHMIKITVFVRLLSVILCNTFFVPDEYWQSTEVAHFSVYKYGYLTWEWREKIRSYLHPFIFELYFRFMKQIALDYAEVLIYGPHVLQAGLCIIADTAVYKLALNIFRNKNVAIFALMLQWLSWFIFYTSSRTLSNTAEMCFLIIGLSYFPFHDINKDLHKRNSQNKLFLTLLFGGIGCIIRSTSFIIWCPFILGCVLMREIYISDLIVSALKVLPPLLLLSFGIDYYFYKELVFVHFNFLKFNIFNNIGVLYGSHPFHWYLTQGIPVVFTLNIILVGIGAYYSRRTTLFWVAMLYIFIHSCIPHKEFRFLLPIYPIFMCYAGNGMEQINKLSKQWRKQLFVFILLLNTVFALYFSVIHQRGTIAVMKHLRQQSLTKNNCSILFMMPCHSTPYYSYLHEDVPLKFLTCHPNQTLGYEEEADFFYKHPGRWWSTNFGNNKSKKPSHIVTYSALAEITKNLLTATGYTKDTSFFHTHFPEGRIGSHVDIYVLE